jgi:hypothetical protein
LARRNEYAQISRSNLQPQIVFIGQTRTLTLGFPYVRAVAPSVHQSHHKDT